MALNLSPSQISADASPTQVVGTVLRERQVKGDVEKVLVKKLCEASCGRVDNVHVVGISGDPGHTNLSKLVPTFPGAMKIWCGMCTPP